MVTPEAFEDLEEAMKKGEIATVRQAHEFLRERHGIEYSHPDGVGQLLRRRKVKLKMGRPRHEKADCEEQEAFKKTSSTPSGEAARGFAPTAGSHRRSWPSTKRVSGLSTGTAGATVPKDFVRPTS